MHATALVGLILLGTICRLIKESECICMMIASNVLTCGHLWNSGTSWQVQAAFRNVTRGGHSHRVAVMVGGAHLSVRV